MANWPANVLDLRCGIKQSVHKVWNNVKGNYLYSA